MSICSFKTCSGCFKIRDGQSGGYRRIFFQQSVSFASIFALCSLETSPFPLAMPRPSASATASRFAAHWVADALAADDALDFSAIMGLLDVSRESLAGAPEAVTERVALRCLQELAAATAEGGAAPAAPPAGMLRFDAARSCEDLLLEIIEEVRSPGGLEKDMLTTFSQDIQNIICIKKPTLQETCFELLREVDPEIACMALPSPMEQNGNNKHDDQSLCSTSHDHAILDKPRFPTDNAKFRQENLANLVNETNTRNIQKDSVEPTPDLHQPCKSDSRCYENPQEDTVGAVGVSARSPENSPTNVEGNMSVAAMPASASCNAALQGSITELLSKQDTVDHTSMVQPLSCGGKSPNPAHYSDGERPHDDGASDQSSKDPSHEEPSMQAIVAPAFDRSNDALPTNAFDASHLPEFITEQDTTIIPQTDTSISLVTSPQHDGCEKVNQDLGYDCTSIQPVEKDSIHEELTLRAASVLASVSCKGAIQGDKSETNHLQGNTEEHTALFEQQNGGSSHMEVGSADEVNEALYSDGSILEKNMVCGGLNVQSASGPCSGNVVVRNKIAEANYLSKQNIEKNTTDVQKRSCSITAPISPQDGDGKRAKKTSNKKPFGNTDKMLSCIKVQDTKGPLRGCSEKYLCIKCGKNGQLLKCSSCLLAAHDSCFGSLVTFEDSNQFYCPVCFYTKATEAYQKAKRTYCEARKNLAAFLGTKQLVMQHDDQPPGVLPRASRSEAHLNGYNSLKKKNSHQPEAHSLAHQDEEPDWQRKRQKTNATSDACPDEVVTEKASSVRNSDVEPMNKHSVLRNNSKQVQDAEKEQQVENTEAHQEAGNGNSYNETRKLSHNKCGPSAANQEVFEVDKEDGLTYFNQSEDSNETEATFSNDCGKRSLPPSHNIRHRKARLQQRETPVSSNSRIAFVQQDQHMPSPSRKQNYAYPTNHHSNPIAPTGRRSKLCWTEEEEAALREAMAKFTPRDNGSIPWVQILEYGRDVFHSARLPCDLRVKWRNMMKKVGS